MTSEISQFLFLCGGLFIIKRKYYIIRYIKYNLVSSKIGYNTMDMLYQTSNSKYS